MASAATQIEPWASPARAPLRDARRRRGKRADASGRMAEDAAARAYRQRGAKILEQRLRTPGGELDLVCRDGDILVFVEVKARKHNLPLDQLVTARQWQRLEDAATHYIMARTDMTGGIRGYRFDLAAIGPDAVPQIIENARSFDTH